MIHWVKCIVFLTKTPMTSDSWLPPFPQVAWSSWWQQVMALRRRRFLRMSWRRWKTWMKSTMLRWRWEGGRFCGVGVSTEFRHRYWIKFLLLRPSITFFIKAKLILSATFQMPSMHIMQFCFYLCPRLSILKYKIHHKKYYMLKTYNLKEKTNIVKILFSKIKIITQNSQFQPDQTAVPLKVSVINTVSVRDCEQNILIVCHCQIKL